MINIKVYFDLLILQVRSYVNRTGQLGDLKVLFSVIEQSNFVTR